MKIKNPEKRLKMFWGEVDKKHVEIIQKFVCGNNILDMGCGYGTTTAHIAASGYNCIGMDYDQAVIDSAKERFPGLNFQFANAEKMPFENNYFDTVILRDALHHFYVEADFSKVRSEILRVSKPNARIIFFDPNINFILKTARKTSRHDDAECDFETAQKIMKQMDCEIIHSSFNTLYSLPLSGGYVGINFIPNIRFLHSFLLGFEKLCERIINNLHLGRYFCWRYVIVGERR